MRSMTMPVKRIVVSAAGEPHGLYRASEGTEALEFARTASRLTEMRSLALPRRHRTRASCADDVA